MGKSLLLFVLLFPFFIAREGGLGFSSSIVVRLKGMGKVCSIYALSRLALYLNLSRQDG